MARKTSEQERIEYLRFKIAYVFLLTPTTPHNKQINVVAISKNETDARKWVNETYPMYTATLITFTSKLLI